MMKLLYESGFKLPDVLHIGCGSSIMENAVNVDIKIPSFVQYDTAQYKNTVILEGDILGPQDFPKKHFKRIEAHMVLEHVHPDLIPNLLYCLCNFLQDNGMLIATVPNFGYLAKRLADLNSNTSLSFEGYKRFREITNEFLCPNMCGMGGHQSIWIKSVAEIWLNAEGFSIVDWTESENKMHVTFRAVKVGGDHVSPV